MRFTGFTITNFKGIGNVRLDFEPAGANVFTLIGLNESGKTTILEAINHHSAMIDEFVALYGEAGDRRSSEELAKLVPKSEQSDFSDKIQIQAHFAFAAGERESIIEHVERECSCKLGPHAILCGRSDERRHRNARTNRPLPRVVSSLCCLSR